MSNVTPGIAFFAAAGPAAAAAQATKVGAVHATAASAATNLASPVPAA